MPATKFPAALLFLADLTLPAKISRSASGQTAKYLECDQSTSRLQSPSASGYRRPHHPAVPCESFEVTIEVYRYLLKDLEQLAAGIDAVKAEGVIRV